MGRLWKVHHNLGRTKDGSMKIKVETWNTDTNPWAQMEQTKQEEMKKVD